jgi:hypothetical protein
MNNLSNQLCIFPIRDVPASLFGEERHRHWVIYAVDMLVVMRNHREVFQCEQAKLGVIILNSASLKT